MYSIGMDVGYYVGVVGNDGEVGEGDNGRYGVGGVEVGEREVFR